MIDAKPDRPSAPPIATLEHAYRVATRHADAHDQDMQVAATGKPDRPFIAEPANNQRKGVVARILAGGQ
jgi:hypothetical protein